MKKVLEALVNLQTSLSLEVILLLMLMAFIIGMIIYFTYKVTFDGVLYNARFNISLVMITLVTTMVMAVIGSNISISLGMVGALSIIRFRTAIKDPRDAAFIFWCIVAGLACGTQNYLLAIIGSLFITVVLVGFKKFVFADTKYVLVIKGIDINDIDINKVLDKIVVDYTCRGKYINDDNCEYIYDVKFKKNDKTHNIDSLKNVKGINTINVIQTGNETLG